MGRKLISGMLIGLLIISFALPANATNIQDAESKEESLEKQKEQAEAEKNSLTAKLNELSVSMKQAAEDLEKKNEEIEAAEQELYESMKRRIKYMYENGDVNLIEVFMESESFSDFLNKAEYIVMISNYDRKRLDDFQNAVKKVEDKELILQAEYEELTAIQDSLAEQKEEAQALLNQKTSEIDDIEDELSEVRAQIQAAEEAEKKKQEAVEAGKNQQTSKPNVSSKPPVVSGSGYFTHPCPGMSYQSSYFGEVRYGIGDTRPHKGHDYAAPEGTPIYAAAAGTVITARYSSSAGYWVVINHGNGLVSKYMHMYTMPFVSEGQRVVKGQHIGGVGTTGQSTGNHLHFQVEVNGVAVNPSNYM